MPISVSCHNPLCARKSIMTIVVNFYPVEYNKTEGIMEKSQWDLKNIRLHSRPFHRLDDFVVQYQHMHSAQLREFVDTGEKKNSKGL